LETHIRTKIKKAPELEKKVATSQTKFGWAAPLKKSHSNGRLLEKQVPPSANHRKDPSANFLMTYYNDQTGGYNSRSLEKALNRAAKDLLARKKSQENGKTMVRKIQAEPSRHQNELLVSAISGKKEYVNINISIGPKKPQAKKTDVSKANLKIKDNKFSKSMKQPIHIDDNLSGHISIEKNTMTRKSSAGNYGLHNKDRERENQPSLIKSRSVKSISVKPSILEEKITVTHKEKSPGLEKSRKKSKVNEKKFKTPSPFVLPETTETRSSKKKTRLTKLVLADERETLEYSYTVQKNRQQSINEPPTAKNPSFKKKHPKDTITSRIISIH
jgi:hypothetical protein